MSKEMSDARLRAEADRILEEKGIRSIVSRYGNVHVCGSYALRLMAWRDLDIYLDLPGLDEKVFQALGAELASALTPTRVSYHNRVTDPVPGEPLGLYYGLRLGDLASGGWKIDLWALEPADLTERIGREERLAARLTDTTRESILAIKGRLWTHPEYRKSITSQDIYRAVLDGGVSDLDGFWAFLGRAPDP